MGCNLQNRRYLGMARRMCNEPNVDIRVCVNEKDIQSLLWLCIGELGHKAFLVGRFFTIVSHDGQLPRFGLWPYANPWQQYRRACWQV